MELSGGEVAAERASSATGEDRISALPDELLLNILLFLRNAADAARTSVLSRRWRTVWTLLPEIRVPFLPEPLSFRRALRASQLRLRCLELAGEGATPESLAVWLPAAARRLSGTLIFLNNAPEMGRNVVDEVEEEDKDALEVPCFEEADQVSLHLGFLPISMPSGVFDQLAILILERVRFCNPSELGDAVSTPRCPRLQALVVRHASGLLRLAITSESLVDLKLVDLGALRELAIEAAVLKELVLISCFREMPRVLPVATISAPRLLTLTLQDAYLQCFVQLGRMPHLQFIGDLAYCVYGIQVPNVASELNTACLKLLQPVKTIKTLSLSLFYTMRDIGNYQYMMEDMKVLPDHEVMCLSVLANGHSFGASSFHILRMCVGIRMLVLTLFGAIHSEAQTPCPPGCVCDEQSNWKIEELSLINLQEIQIQKLRGSEHEVSFVKRLFNWATTLNKITVVLDPSTTERKTKELFQMFESLSRPGVCMELYRNHKKVSYEPLIL